MPGCCDQMCFSVRRSVRCEPFTPLTWFLSDPSLSPEWASFIIQNCSPRSLSSWLVPTEHHRPTLRIFLLIFPVKNIWPDGRNIYIRQLLHNQREWSLSSVGSVGPLCVFVTDRDDNESSAGVNWGHWGPLGGQCQQTPAESLQGTIDWLALILCLLDNLH